MPLDVTPILPVADDFMNCVPHPICGDRHRKPEGSPLHAVSYDDHLMLRIDGGKRKTGARGTSAGLWG